MSLKNTQEEVALMHMNFIYAKKNVLSINFCCFVKGERVKFHGNIHEFRYFLRLLNAI